MNVIDKNQTLQPPEGEADFATPIGSFLTLQYREWDKGFITRVYLNDQGREVLRTIEKARTRVEEEEEAARKADERWETEIAETMKPLKQIEMPPLQPERLVGRRHRFAAGFWLMLEGIREMSICLRP